MSFQETHGSTRSRSEPILRHTASDMKDGINGGQPKIGIGFLTVFAGTVYGLLSGFSTVEFRDDRIAGYEPLAKRNMDVFKQMKDLSVLNAASRVVPWAARQDAITQTIAANGKTGWDWIPFTGYSSGPRDSMNRAKIALVPHAEGGRPAQLVVDSSHGCLMVGFEKTNDQNVADALSLLHAFREKSAGDYNYHGHYEVGAEGKVLFTPRHDPVAAQYCPAI